LIATESSPSKPVKGWFARRGLLETKVERAYSLGEFAEAVARASEGKRDGKVVFRM